jgi:radical SAM protein with 4Fe4S-binding SPASM domain
MSIDARSFEEVHIDRQQRATEACFMCEGQIDDAFPFGDTPKVVRCRPIVLPDGTVMACSCVAPMDATDDLAIGNVMESSLLEMWVSERMKQIRASFGSKKLNKTCAGCDMYRNPELYRTSEGRERARVNLARYEGKVVKRAKRASGAFSGG